ncbi:ATP synthase F1 subunit gamma [Rickettsiales endosymbiont of Peranema trichophorum]|uniref:ATP synthase F1 subunit gamma n=1 Tax=Rickettsiales endosymbiont of Peranema trichophorum TaxID=2486577 RepID=UPI00102351C0|nr:ATP synthase F1 subunit gamma [Rickettsiales endosymbiont of Peranema trichophorum]RZI45550.1 ATP synthase F1 subunit gamma [Rickettsiales endosymbiont of Peranema trichophorum]
MSSLKSLRTRINGIKSTQKLTKAMKMVAASKLKKARDIAEASLPYATALNAMTRSIVSNLDDVTQIPALLSGRCKREKVLLLVVTGDRGLCGTFNASIVRAVKAFLDTLSDSSSVDLICIGRKGYELLKRQHCDMISYSINIGTSVDHPAIAKEIGGRLVASFTEGRFDICWMFYHQFESLLVQVPIQEQLIPLPVDVADVGKTAGSVAGNLSKSEKNVVGTLYKFEPSSELVLQNLVTKNIEAQVLKAVLSSYAGEQGARMVAMDGATQSSDKILKNLSFVYNRTRQASITKELIEVISGAEAV